VVSRSRHPETAQPLYRVTMLLLDDILLAPIKLPIAGFNWILRQIQTMANEEH